MNFIIIGLGNFGASLAKKLTALGHDVIGVDKEIEKVDDSKLYVWLPGEFQAIQYGVEGMKVGGVRKLTVPKEMNVSNPGLASTRPSGVPLSIEVELVTLRNLPQRRR